MYISKETRTPWPPFMRLIISLMYDTLQILESFCIGPLVAGGDLNCLADVKLDHAGIETSDVIHRLLKDSAVTLD